VGDHPTTSAPTALHTTVLIPKMLRSAVGGGLPPNSCWTAPVAAIRKPLGNGQVNGHLSGQAGRKQSPCFVLQRLNTQVFPQPELVMGNLVPVSAHVSAGLRQGFQR